MANFFKAILFATLLSISFSSCTTSEKTAGTSASTSRYPAWYSPAGFASDSTAFHGYATAVSSDSVVAIANAELQARTNLESSIARKMEKVRVALEEKGSSVATNSDFILTLRNAHNQVQEAAKKVSGEARPKDGYYTGFAQVTISKSEFRELLEAGFSGKSSYWNSFSSSAAFAEEMQ